MQALDDETTRFESERRRAGRFLAGLRRRHRLTQEQVARRVGVDVRTIRRIEAGRSASVDTYDRLASYLLLPRDWFLRPDLYETLADDEAAVDMVRRGAEFIGASGRIGLETVRYVAALVEFALHDPIRADIHAGRARTTLPRLASPAPRPTD